MITIQLVGGPDDGAEVRVEKHPYEWLMPRPAHFPIEIHKVVPGHIPLPQWPVAVYRQRRGTDQYEFHGVRRL